MVGPAAIPQFHFPHGKPLSSEASQAVQSKLDHLFNVYSTGLTVPAVKELVKEVSDHAFPTLSWDCVALWLKSQTYHHCDDTGRS